VYTNRVTTKDDHTSEYKDIGTLYVVAEQMLDVQTRNLALQAMYERIREPGEDGTYYYPGTRCLLIVYGGTATATDPMRRLLVDVYRDIGGGSLLRLENVEHYHKEFLLDLAIVASKGRPTKTAPMTYDMGKYFEEQEKEAAAARGGDGAGKT
jgi:hypothetical protein